MGARILLPVMPECHPIVGGQVYCYAHDLLSVEFAELVVQLSNVDSELEIRVQHDELFVGEDAMVERAHHEQVIPRNK